jgi:hypothetical protein
MGHGNIQSSNDGGIYDVMDLFFSIHGSSQKKNGRTAPIPIKMSAKRPSHKS